MKESSYANIHKKFTNRRNCGDETKQSGKDVQVKFSKVKGKQEKLKMQLMGVLTENFRMRKKEE